MSNADPFFKTFVFDSPVEFVLIGVVGKKRAVVAKSRGAQLDLVAYAQRDRDDNENVNWLYQSSAIVFILPFSTSIRLHPLTVDSSPAVFPRNHTFDKRATECTLVWRGLECTGDTSRIKEELDIRINDIVEALEQESSSQLEWALAPVIDQCHRTIVHFKNKKLRMARLFWFTLLVYVMGILFFFLFRLLVTTTN